jgi:non-specific serine/threonine protein kinase
MQDTELSNGTILAARYRLEEILGEGGMGRVFAAVDQQLGRRVAVKLIRDDLNDAPSRDRFLREAQSAAVLSHRNACQLFEVGEHEGRPFLVLEFLEGEPLSTRLKRGRMGRDEAIGVLLPLMDALIEFHAAGLIHRDIKPSNVFLTPHGAKLLDFGLARRTERDDAMTAPALTAPGAIAGTLRYMAPEQLTGDPIDARTDVFALGVMFFEMLTGRVPFGHGSKADWLKAVLTEAPESLDDPDLRDLDPIVARALARRPEDRYATVEEMSAALREAIGSGEAPAAPPPPKRQGAVRAVILPFRMLNEESDVAALQHGVPEKLTALLAGKDGWQFLSNRVAQDFAAEPDLMAVGRSLKVDRLLTGSILHDADKFCVTVQMIGTNDGSVLWSQTTEHKSEGVVGLQDEICRSIVEGLVAAQ